MKRQKYFISVLLGLSILALAQQNCAKISYGHSDDLINKNAIDGTLGGGNGGGSNGNSNVVQFPDATRNKMTVAFEDLMTTTNASSDTDLDYNDFVMTYNVREESEDNYLKKIEVFVTPQARKAGYEAQLILSLKGALSQSGEKLTKPAFRLENSIQAKIEYFDQDGRLLSSAGIDVQKPVVVFRKTSELFMTGQANLEAGTSADPIRVQCQEKARIKAKITIMGFSKTDENKARKSIEVQRYPFYLYVEDTKTLMGTVDLNPAHKSKDGYPMAFQVHGTYLHPAARVAITTVFPYFTYFVKWLNNKTLNAEEQQKAIDWHSWLDRDWSRKLACSPL